MHHYPYRSAYMRVGYRIEANLKWLLEFSERSISGLTSNEEQELRDEVLAFTFLGYVKQTGLVADGNTLRKSIEKLVASGLGFSKEDLENELPLKTISHLHILTRTALAEYRINGGYSLPPVAFFRRVQREHKGGIVYTFPLPGPTKALTCFIEQLAEVLKQEGWRLQSCSSEVCGKVFIENRYGQQYCSNRCRSRVAMRQQRETAKFHEQKTTKRSKSK